MKSLAAKVRAAAAATFALLLAGQRQLLNFNKKLGLYTWNTLAWFGCNKLGKTEFCEHACYAQAAQFNYSTSQAAQLARLQLVNRDLDRFVHLMTVEARARSQRGERSRCGKTGRLVIRLHSAGDVHTARYLEALHHLAMSVPEVTWLLFTRSWRDPNLADALYRFAALPNVTVLCSVDMTHEDRPPRVNPVNGDVLKRAYVEGTHDAPAANCRKQLDKVDCTKCGRCWLENCDVTLKPHGYNALRYLAK